MKNIYNLDSDKKMGNNKNYIHNPIMKKETIYDILKDKPKEPILRGCRNKVCFCSGSCREIVGWK